MKTYVNRGLFGRPNPTRVLCIGNSVTAGVVAGGGTAYVDALREKLGRNYRVTNRGGGGTSVLDWMRPPVKNLPAPLGGAYEKLAQAFLPSDYAVVELGGNDAVAFWEKRPTPVETYSSTMLRLVTRLRKDGARRVLVLTPIPNPSANASAKGRLLAYRLSLLGMPWPPGASVLDIYKLLDPKKDYDPYNPHPNEQGHEKIAEAVYQQIRRRGCLGRICKYRTKLQTRNEKEG
jgi:lysophospholipase L1-like esterase